MGVVEDLALGGSGPLWVRGGITIESGEGTPYEVPNKPLCNGSHASVKFKEASSNSSGKDLPNSS